jgi:hypothetical protein
MLGAMQFKDLKQQYDANAAQRRQLFEAVYRRWLVRAPGPDAPDFGLAIKVELDRWWSQERETARINVYATSYAESLDSLDIKHLSSDDLRCVTAAKELVEKWQRGELAELPRKWP